MRRRFVVALITLVASAATGQQVPYLQRLQMPVRGDAFRSPRAVVADLHAEEVFVCDTLNHRIVIFDDQGLFKYSIQGGERFRSPIDLAVDPEGYLLVLGFFGGRRGFTVLDFDGLFLESVELTGFPEGIRRPDLQSLALSPDGRTVVTVDQQNHRLWISDRSGEILAWFDFEEGRTEEEIQDLILARADLYDDEILVAVPSDSLVYRFGLDGSERGFVGLRGNVPCTTAFPVAAALDSEGMIWILDKQRTVFMRWNPSNNKCLDEHWGFGNVPGALYQPDDISLDRTGKLYVAQGFEGRIQVYDGAVPAAEPKR